ncbi:MAG: cytochrome b/b6 domain-containing protein [Pseudomonadota bacterium]
MKDPHEFGFDLLRGFVGLHLAALVFHQLRGERVAQRMVTGRQYLDIPAAGVRPGRRLD